MHSAKRLQAFVTCLPCAASHPCSLLASWRLLLPARPLPPWATYLMLLAAIVYCAGSSLDAMAQTKPSSGTKPPPSASWPITAQLPPAAEDMRQAILTATHAGDINELKIAFDLGELKADIADEPVDDPVAYWKKISADGEGREILAVLADLLAVGPAEVARGKDPENNAVYVWPYLAELDLSNLNPAQQVDLMRLVPPAEAKAMMAQKKWTWWRLTIGADGLWHAFKKGS